LIVNPLNRETKLENARQQSTDFNLPEYSKSIRWHSLPALFWLSSYVTGHHMALVPQLGAKD
jgi:hypothetical protein